MENELNYCHGILIHNLSQCGDAIKSLEKSVSISSSSVVSVFKSKFGINIVFDGYEPFHRAITKGVLIVNYVPYHVYPMVTNMTVIGAYSFLNERTLKSLMKNIAPVLFVYREKDVFSEKFTNNFRVIMDHPEIYDIVHLWTLKGLQIPGCSTPLPIALFCRLCRENGHTRHECNKRIQSASIFDETLQIKLKMESTVYLEDNQRLPEDQPTQRKRNISVLSYQKSLENPPSCNNDKGNKHNKTIYSDQGRNAVRSSQDIIEQPYQSENDKGNKHKNHNIPSEQQIEKTTIKKKKKAHVLSTNPDYSKIIEPNLRKPKKYMKSNFLRLIPQELRTVVPQLKIFLSNVVNEKCSKNMCEKAELYPKGINELLQHLKTVVAYNLEKMSNRYSLERRLIIFMDSVVGKINEELSKNDNEKCPVKREISNEQSKKFSSVGIRSDIEPIVLQKECEFNNSNKRYQESDSSKISERRKDKMKVRKKEVPLKFKEKRNSSHKDFLKNSKRLKSLKNRDSAFIKNMKDGVNKRNYLELPKRTMKVKQGMEKDQKLKKFCSNTEIYDEKNNIDQSTKNYACYKERSHSGKTNICSAESISKRISQKNGIPKRDGYLSLLVTEYAKNGNHEQKEVLDVQEAPLLKESTLPLQIYSGPLLQQKFQRSTSPGNTIYNGNNYSFYHHNRQFQIDHQVTSKEDEAKKDTDTGHLHILHHSKVNRLENIIQSLSNSDVRDDLRKIPSLVNPENEFLQNRNKVTEDPVDSMKMMCKAGFGINQINLKDLVPSTIQTTVKEDPKKKRRFSSKLSLGLLAAIRCSKGILKSSELKAFLTHVRGKVHVRQVAKKYSTEVNQIIEQLEMILKQHYRRIKMTTFANKEVKWLDELVKRLKSHENCKTCQNCNIFLIPM